MKLLTDLGTRKLEFVTSVQFLWFNYYEYYYLDPASADVEDSQQYQEFIIHLFINNFFNFTFNINLKNKFYLKINEE